MTEESHQRTMSLREAKKERRGNLFIIHPKPQVISNLKQSFTKKMFCCHSEGSMTEESHQRTMSLREAKKERLGNLFIIHPKPQVISNPKQSLQGGVLLSFREKYDRRISSKNDVIARSDEGATRQSLYHSS
ncbi:hypothetical protein ACFPH8_08900 [Bizionia hallyeonensis]|uniref:Uncharacterized protein n=1 Tax=Bizionia hallyeonensis TaxID=1123757 RepID=A0ABW0C600_9FLAO